MLPVILFRTSLDQENEFHISSKYFTTFDSRTKLPKNSLVIGRYSVLPFYKELENDLKNIDCELVNSYPQHQWIANISQWYEQLKNYTFPTYFDRWDLLPEDSYVLKGNTNSRKSKWQTHMFAKTKADVPIIFGNLLCDTLIGQQGIVVRKYIPLKTFEIGINGLPITNEYRLFYYKDQYIAGGFYWSFYDGDDKPSSVPDDVISFANKIAKIAENYTNFFVLDIAETINNEWILVEINDGQMSGLSDIDPENFYLKLKENMTALH